MELQIEKFTNNMGTLITGKWNENYQLTLELDVLVNEDSGETEKQRITFLISYKNYAALLALLAKANGTAWKELNGFLNYNRATIGLDPDDTK